MNKKIRIYRRFAGLLIFITLFFQASFSQQSSIMYYMQGVPQSHILNPATQPRCGFYLGLPGLSPLQFKVENSAFSLSDVFMWNGDSTITFLHPDASFDDFRSNFKKVNYLSSEVSTALISYGFRSKNTFHTFDITQRVISRFSYPGDLLDLYYGTHFGDEFDFSGFGFDGLAFLEIGSGMSKKISDLLNIGYRFKILFGEANISSKKSDLTLDFNEDDITAHSKFDMNAAVPGLNIPKDSNGEIIPEDIGFWEEPTPVDIINAITGSWGLGLDLGVHVRPIESLTISASILDLGFIRWNQFAYNLSQDEVFIFNGFELPNDSDKLFDLLEDSIANSFKVTNSENPYTTYLPAKIYIGAKYDLIEQISISILSRTEIYKGRLRQQFNFAANFYPIKMVSATLNYAIENHTYDNLGAGLALKAGPFNFYLISDNIPLVYARELSSDMIIPYKARTANLRIGFNLVFGCQKQKKYLKDLPLID